MLYLAKEIVLLKAHQLTIVLFISFLANQAFASEYLYQQPILGEMSLKQALKTGQYPDMNVGSRCSGSPIVICSYYATNQRGTVIRTFSTGKHKVITARYPDKAYMIMQSAFCSFLSCDTYQVLQSSGKLHTFTQQNVVAPYVSGEGMVHFLTQKQYVVRHPNGKVEQSIDTPEKIIDGVFGSNAKGQVSAVAIGETGAVYLYTGTHLLNLGFKLTEHGDREDIISLYPTKDAIYIASYRYTNAYNKGIYLLKYMRDSHSIHGGWLVNSETKNVGFDISIYKKKTQIIVSAKDSSQQNYVHFKLTDTDLQQLQQTLPQHVVEGEFEDEPFISFMLGGLLSHVSLAINSSIPYDNQTFSTALSIQLSDAWLKGVSFEGRAGSYPISFQYAQNQAESIITQDISQAGIITSKQVSRALSHQLFASIDLQGLFPTSTATRLQFEEAAISGLAHATDYEGNQVSHTFRTQLQQSSLLFLHEKSIYWGLTFKTLTAPIKIGVSDSNKTTVYTGVDLAAQQKTLKLVLGYDRIAYAKRYETDFKEFYWSGNLNLGLGLLDLSPAFSQAALKNLPNQSFSPNHIFGEIGTDIEFGYIWQNRFRSWKGFGYSIAGGYLVRAAYARGSRSDDASQLETNNLYTNIDYTLFMHGPFFRVNILF